MRLPPSLSSPPGLLCVAGAARGLLFLIVVGATALRADTPPLLAQAVEKWDALGQDLAFTQEMIVRDKDPDAVKSQRARYDPSRPDRERWRLLEIDGRPATDEQRAEWEKAKNARPRNRGGLSPSAYLDLPNARLLEETDSFASYEAAVRKDKARLVAIDQLAIVLQVDKKTESITHVRAVLREPMKIAFGLAKITDLDLDLPLEAACSGAPPGEVHPEAVAKLTLTKLGQPVEYHWSDFDRVPAHPGSNSAKDARADL